MPVKYVFVTGGVVSGLGKALPLLPLAVFKSQRLQSYHAEI